MYMYFAASLTLILRWRVTFRPRVYIIIINIITSLARVRSYSSLHVGIESLQLALDFHEKEFTATA